MKKSSAFIAALLLSGVLQGCDLLSAPDRPAEAAQAKPTPVPTLAPTPTPESIPLPPEVEPGTGQPVQVEWSDDEKSGSAAEPTPRVKPAANNQVSDLQKRYEAAGGKYYPPASSFGQRRGRWTDAVSGQCQYPLKGANR